MTDFNNNSINRNYFDSEDVDIDNLTYWNNLGIDYDNESHTSFYNNTSFLCNENDYDWNLYNTFPENSTSMDNTNVDNTNIDTVDNIKEDTFVNPKKRNKTKLFQNSKKQINYIDLI